MPNILTPAVQTDYLSDEAYQHDELELLIERAERKTLNRYRETDTNDSFEDEIEELNPTPLRDDIQLDGYIRADDGTIDLTESDPALVDSLRAAVANIVEFWVDKPDQSRHVSRMDQGDRRVDFRDADLPPSVYAPLRRFDARTPFY